uniref:USP domain-containing protein n=1 Tax=Erpetoichthys calabaricus TaxID=27687 RepID=A0A8C4X981_ERPCA
KPQRGTSLKRLLIKKLPPVLAIQLKRFDYDWERECAIKFNDYFEFPRELDMEPYTVAGVAKNGGDGEKNRWYKFDDGDVTECKMDDEEEMKNQCFGGEYMGEVFDHMMKQTDNALIFQIFSLLFYICKNFKDSCI